MGRSQRHKVIVQQTDSSGKGLSEKQPSPRYIIQAANSQAFSTFTGPAGGPLQGSTIPGFPPTLIPPPTGLMRADAELQAAGEFTDPGQFNLSGNPIYTDLPPSNQGGGGGTGPNPAPGEEPTLDTINPDGCNTEEPPQLVNINGTNFTDTSVVFLDGVAQDTTFLSATQLQITIDGSKHAVGLLPIVVFQGSYHTDQKMFTVANPQTPLAAGPIAISRVEDHDQGIQLTLAGAGVEVGNTVRIEATGNTNINGDYEVLSVDGTTIVVNNDFGLAAPIEGKGRVTVIA